MHDKVINGCCFLLLAGRKETRLRTACACVHPSLNINAPVPQDTHRPAHFCVYTSTCASCRCTTEKGLCAHMGGTFFHLQFDPQGGPRAPLVPAVLLQASFRQAVLQLPSSAAALWICFHQYIIHLFIYCLSKGIVC